MLFGRGVVSDGWRGVMVPISRKWPAVLFHSFSRVTLAMVRSGHLPSHFLRSATRPLHAPCTGSSQPAPC